MTTAERWAAIRRVIQTYQIPDLLHLHRQLGPDYRGVTLTILADDLEKMGVTRRKVKRWHGEAYNNWHYCLPEPCRSDDNEGVCL